MENHQGIQVLGGLKGCPFELLDKAEIVCGLLNKAVVEAGFNKVGEAFHQFKPYGVTGVILIGESHVSIHTWPEHNFAAVDVFTCGKEGSAEKGFDAIVRLFKAKDFSKQVIKR